MSFLSVVLALRFRPMYLEVHGAKFNVWMNLMQA